MPDREKVLEVAREWVAKAENHLKNATHTLKLGDDCPADTVCFHAQQCVEKYLKAVLVLDEIDFPKTHDLEEIVALLPSWQPARVSWFVDAFQASGCYVLRRRRIATSE